MHSRNNFEKIYKINKISGRGLRLRQSEIELQWPLTATSQLQKSDAWHAASTEYKYKYNVLQLNVNLIDIDVLSKMVIFHRREAI